MKKKRKVLTMMMLLIGVILLGGGNTVHAKTKKLSMNLEGGKVRNLYPKTLENAVKVKVKSSKPSVVKIKYKKNKSKVSRELIFTAKKLGKATVTVKCTMKNKKVKTLKYKVTVKKVKRITEKQMSKQAFKIQNRYRKEKGVKELQWSDELYEFARFRLTNSGYDGHKNLLRDEVLYFGNYALFKNFMFAENMCSSSPDAKDAMEAWKGSKAHYKNLLSQNHVCGAIACRNDVWCAIFYDGDKSEVDNWKSYQIKEVKVRRFDSGSGKYLDQCSIGYYEEGDKWNTQQAASLIRKSGKIIYLEVGKTYVIYERTKPDGYEKAEPVTITVTADSPDEVILSNSGKDEKE